MKIVIRKGNEIWSTEKDTADRLIGVLTDEATEQDEIAIECGTEVLPAVTKFIDNVNNGNYKPRTAVKELERIIEKYSI